jgi:hypothetical protein
VQAGSRPDRWVQVAQPCLTPRWPTQRPPMLYARLGAPSLASHHPAERPPRRATGGFGLRWRPSIWCLVARGTSATAGPAVAVGSDGYAISGASSPHGASGKSAAPYVLPRHPTEVDRRDIQHYAMRDALSAEYLSPLRHPLLILDVGCGTGQWAFELCAQFPEAVVVGLDIEPSKPERPTN